MPKIRVHELAKELGLSNKDMLDKLQGMGISATSHMSSLEDNDVKRVNDTVKPAAKPETKPAAQTPERSVSRPETTRDNRTQSGPRPQNPQRPQGVRRPQEGGAQKLVYGPGERKPQPNRPPRPQGGSMPKLVYGPGEKKPVRPQRPTHPGEGRPVRPAGQRPAEGYVARPVEAKPAEQQPATEPRPQTQTPAPAPAQTPRTPSEQRPQGGSRPYQGNSSRSQDGGAARPQQSGNRPYQGGSRPPYQGGNRPAQGGNRPPQSGNRPYQGGARPQQGGARPGGATRGGRPAGGPARAPETVTQQRPQRTGAPGQHQKPGQRNNYSSKRENTNSKLTPRPMPAPKPEPAIPAEPQQAYIPENLTVKELAAVMGRNSSELLKHMMKKGIMANINQMLDFDAAADIALEFNYILEREQDKDIMGEAFKEEPENEENLKPRPPVVVVMGHVDHGKTSLLDAIRHSKVTAGEAGGITQHIGAYTVDVNGRQITFLDTPGHEAFTAMRMRGAQVTDVAVLVVAADDGVMPQTIEAINHAKAAGVEIIVAINKIDKPSANPDRVKQELTEYGLVAEDWGGDTICVPVSAVTKEGIDTLLEMILLSTEMKELKANPDRKARGAIIEAKLDKGRGPIATGLVQTGTLRVGDPIVVGQVYGKVRAMMDDKGRRVKTAGPSQPVEILGLNEVPAAGDTFYVADSEKQARFLAEAMTAKSRKEMIKNPMQKVSLDDLFSQIKAGDMKELNIVVKADVQGSVEAVRQSLEKLSNDEVRVRIIHGGVGTINESDVMLASASNAIIIGFNVRPEAVAKAFADEEKVDVRLYRVIYQAIDDVKTAMTGMLDPIFEEQVQGHAEVRATFKASGVGTIAGSFVTDGKITRACQARVKRGTEVIFDGEIESLKRFKDDVKEVREGYECGIVLKKFNDLREGDIIEAYLMVEVPRK